jgi:hypothetical protein
VSWPIKLSRHNDVEFERDGVTLADPESEGI